LRLATTEGTRQLELLHEGPLLPSTLALARLGATPSCLAVVDEVDGTVGQVCGTREERRASGTLFGEPFEAELDGVRPVRLLLPRQQAAFAAVEGRPAIGSPPALFGQPVATSGAKPPPGAPATLELDFEGAPPRLPSTGSQHVERGGERVRVRWSPAGPGTREPLRRVSRGTDVLGRAAERGLAGATDRWQAAVALARFVAEQLPDKRPAEWERSPARVLEEGRASCVGHSALFVALANRVGLPARRVAGVVAQDGRFYAHAWAQVEVGGRWWDVEPTEGEAPASSPRVLLAPDADGPAAGRLLGLTRGLSIRFVDGAAQEAKP
ncbi:MAG: transglutaminase-like domain-containing protein, partial [Myxococcales bacterium]